MTASSAKALVAKLQSDKTLQAAMKKAKSEQDFLDVAKKHGFEVTLAEFHKAVKEMGSTKKDLKDEELDKVAGGLSIVGVDYAFVGVQTAKH